DQRDLVEQKTVHVILYVYCGIMVTDKLHEVHQVIGIELVGVSLVRTVHREQGKGNVLSGNISPFSRHISITELGEVDTFKDVCIDLMVIVLPVQEALDAHIVVKGKDGVFVEDGRSVELALEELFLWGIAQLHVQLGGVQLMDVGQASVVLHL